jgi:hypothetical protein
MQFHLVGLSREQADQFVVLMIQEGLGIQIFGVDGNARDYRQWAYLDGAEKVDLPETVKNIEFAVDLSLQPHLGHREMDVISDVIHDVLDYLING